MYRSAAFFIYDTSVQDEASLSALRKAVVASQKGKMIVRDFDVSPDVRTSLFGFTFEQALGVTRVSDHDDVLDQLFIYVASGYHGLKLMELITPIIIDGRVGSLSVVVVDASGPAASSHLTLPESSSLSNTTNSKTTNPNHSSSPTNPPQVLAQTLAYHRSTAPTMVLGWCVRPEQVPSVTSWIASTIAEDMVASVRRDLCKSLRLVFKERCHQDLKTHKLGMAGFDHRGMILLDSMHPSGARATIMAAGGHEYFMWTSDSCPVPPVGKITWTTQDRAEMAFDEETWATIQSNVQEYASSNPSAIKEILLLARLLQDPGAGQEAVAALRTQFLPEPWGHLFLHCLPMSHNSQNCTFLKRGCRKLESMFMELGLVGGPPKASGRASCQAVPSTAASTPVLPVALSPSMDLASPAMLMSDLSAAMPMSPAAFHMSERQALLARIAELEETVNRLQSGSMGFQPQPQAVEAVGGAHRGVCPNCLYLDQGYVDDNLYNGDLGGDVDLLGNPEVVPAVPFDINAALLDPLNPLVLE